MNTTSAKNVEGVTTRVPQFGSTSPMSTLDEFGTVPYMKPLVDYLVNTGYENGLNLKGAPYDFRYSPETIPGGYYNQLKVLVEEMYISNGNHSVTLLSHSYGCHITLLFLHLQTQQWKNRFLKQWVTLSGPFGGSILEALVYLTGYIEEPFRKLINSLDIRSGQRSFTSNLFMLPSLAAWDNDYVIVKSQRRNYTTANLNDLLRDIDFLDGIRMRDGIMNSSYLLSTVPGLPIKCFYGNIPNSTINQIGYSNDKDFPDSPSELLSGDGDGTVNIESLSLCKMFNASQQNTLSMQVLPGVSHLDILNNEMMHSILKDLLTK